MTGQAGSFEAGRKVEVIVTEGKKVKLTRTEQIGIPGENGKFYVPLWLYPAMCDEVKITAKNYWAENRFNHNSKSSSYVW